MSKVRAEPDDVLTFLVNRLRRTQADGRGSVFILGAGCSRQYGLPDFRELLTHLWEDIFHSSPDFSLSIEALRDKLDWHWKVQGPRARREALEPYLKRVKGKHCPGYLRLAALAREGYVKAFVNMNFDTLLEEAMVEESVPLHVSTSFQASVDGCMTVYKPHGTLGDINPSGVDQRGANELILDIAKGDLFANALEERSTHQLLTSTDVVILGYSGVDAKIANALLSFQSGQEPRDYKLFVVSLTPPDSRLALTMEERGSRDLLVLGESGAFDSFMEQLEQELLGSTVHVPVPGDVPARDLGLPSGLFSRAEAEAASQCLFLAHEIRSGINVPDRSRVSLEAHARVVFGKCLDLAHHAGLCLTSPERYLLYAAAALHDLGYFAAYSVDDFAEGPGWHLLSDHGEDTVKLVKRKLYEDEDWQGRIIPATYDKCDHIPLVNAILYLCRYHPSWVLIAEASQDIDIRVSGRILPIRTELLLSLFAAAEDLVPEQPFLPFPDLPAPPNPPLLEAGVQASMGDRRRWIVEDPVLDLYLRHKANEVSFEVKRGKVIGTAKACAGESPSQAASWFLTIAATFVKQFSERVRIAGGWGLTFIVESGSEHGLSVRVEEPPDALLVKALEGTLESSLGHVPKGSSGEASSILDLIAIYSIRGSSDEPRISLRIPCVRKGLTRVRKIQHRSAGLLHLYLPIKWRGPKNQMEKIFLDSFEEIIYPAWRNVARRWRNKSASIPMAYQCLSLGSSRFRGEVTDGLRYLLNEIVRWSDDGTLAYGHDECTLCTSRLLYIFSYSRRLFAGQELLEFRTGQDRRGIDEAVAGLLRYLMAREPDDTAWWGLGAASGLGIGMKAPDYLAEAARAVAVCLQVDRDIVHVGRNQEKWLSSACGIDQGGITKLVRQRWDHLLAVHAHDLVAGENELTSALTLAQVAVACLDLRYLDKEVQEIAGWRGEPRRLFLAQLQTACNELRPESLSLVSRLHLWPALTLLDAESAKDEKKSALFLASLCLACVTSPVWIRTGPDAGSWCFDTKNTQPILTALVAFWRHAFSEGFRSRFEEAFSALQAPQAGGFRGTVSDFVTASGSPRSSRPRRSGRPGSTRRARLTGGGPS